MAPAGDGGGTERSGHRRDPSADGDNPTVLVADGSTRCDRFRSWLSPTFSVETGCTKAAAEAEAAAGVDVSILGAGVPPEAKQELLETIDLRAPFARVVVIPHDDQPPMLGSPGYDACVYAPVEQEHLLEVTKRMGRIAIYERTVANYFEYTTQAASMEVARKEGAIDDETYQELQQRIDWLQDRLRRMRKSLDEADKDVLLESLEVDPTTGFDGDVRKSSNRRQPDECTACGLDWQVDHGGDLGSGCEQLGAFVWKCRQCGTVQQPGTPSHQWVA